MNRVGNGNINPSIQIWRPSRTTYSRISEHRINNDDLNNDLATVTFARVDVELDDVIGYYLPSGLRNTVWNIQTSGFTSYIMNVNSALSSFDINDTNIQTTDDRQPLIQTIFSEIYLL